jgi:putative hydrolases of HD superfamily
MTEHRYNHAPIMLHMKKAVFDKDMIFPLPLSHNRHRVSLRLIICFFVSIVVVVDSLSMSSSYSTPFQYVTFITQICGKLKDIKRTGWVRSGIPFPESDADHMHRCAMCALLLFQPFTTTVAATEDTSNNMDEEENMMDSSSHPYALSRLNDPYKVLKMALTHDVCEALAGDITPHCSNLSEKEHKEQASMEAIRNILGDPLGKELYDLWREYEDQITIESIYCKDIDKFEMIVQAFEYEDKYLQYHHHTTPSTRNSNSSIETSKMTTDMVLLEPLRGFFQSTRGVFRTPLFQTMDYDLRQRRESLLIQRGWAVTEEERSMP